MALKEYQQDCISILVKSGVLRFGKFTLKSGRQSPYFFNLGEVSTGGTIKALARCYAQAINDAFGQNFNVLFGPAYKGVPLIVAISEALEELQQRPIGFSFNRKEKKTHGEGDTMVGHRYKAGDRVVIVEDVIAAGTTFHEVKEIFKHIPDAAIVGGMLAVDRCEKGSGAISALNEVRQALEIDLRTIISIYDVVTFLSVPNQSGMQLPEEQLQDMKGYLSVYGA